MRGPLLLALCALAASGCTASPAADGLPPGTAPAAVAGTWQNRTLDGTAYAIATGNGYLIDPRDPDPQPFEVAAGAAWLEILVTPDGGGIAFTLLEPGCTRDPASPTTRPGCERRIEAGDGPAAERIIDPVPGSWHIDVEPPGSTSPGPWQAAYTAAIGVQSRAS